MELALYQGTNLILLLVGAYYTIISGYLFFKVKMDRFGFNEVLSYMGIAGICLLFVIINHELSHPIIIFESRCVWFNELLIVPIYLGIGYFASKSPDRDPNVLASIVILFVVILGFSAYLMFGLN